MRVYTAKQIFKFIRNSLQIIIELNSSEIKICNNVAVTCSTLYVARCRNHAQTQRTAHKLSTSEY